MRVLVCSVITMVLLLDAGVRAKYESTDAKETESPKLVVEHLEKKWGIKHKKMVAKDIPTDKQTEIIITLGFTQDIPDLMLIQDAFAPSASSTMKFDGVPLVFHLFDDDNVSMGKFRVRRIEGDLSGVKGDAFRIVLICDTDKFKKAKKVEARLLTPPN